MKRLAKYKNTPALMLPDLINSMYYDMIRHPLQELYHQAVYSEESN